MNDIIQESLFNLIDENYYFYYKNNKKEIVPVQSVNLNILAKEKLDEIKNKYNDIPLEFKVNFENVKLYHPKGDIEKAHSLILNPNDGAYSLKNKLNHLTGKEWTKFTCSWFIFNALKSDLKKEKELIGNSDSHPATFSPTMIEDFIKFFTKENDAVLDPFAGIGSTLEAAKRTNRIGYGIELNEKYFTMIKERLPEFQTNIFNDDSRNLKKLNLPKINYSISSPPYWDVLNRSTDGFKKERVGKNLDYNYSDNPNDLGNMDDYNQFLNELSKIYIDMYDLLADGAYITIIIKNVKKEGRLYPIAWDLARILSSKYVLKDEKIWIQDKIALSPYGYPYSWASNILHHYCLILRKE
ncbi:DNA methyltransferase [Mammaliicoccus sciuri]|uniref:DNA methyltransferase n=1 Tax=Mammaliicoccus sciuri TaxID=1296 RepID=UPI001F10E8EE|nr:DNA methyltransferase [Mammaliicoccus sciuri]MCH5141745.1 site-specific DNA-methyltransferase [Mammaliicoccus sciuri]MEB6696398.1 site-specific DNA-methyltransferase [Mammaliicoccus sciuri]WQK42518.1 DNA methyltransferase [Mammaliicoccus sciuri]